MNKMIRQIAPQFFTTDIPATLAYYKDKLGFECLGTWPDPPVDAPVYAIVARDQQVMVRDDGPQMALDESGVCARGVLETADDHPGGQLANQDRCSPVDLPQLGNGIGLEQRWRRRAVGGLRGGRVGTQVEPGYVRELPAWPALEAG